MEKWRDMFVNVFLSVQMFITSFAACPQTTVFSTIAECSCTESIFSALWPPSHVPVLSERDKDIKP